MLAIWLTVHAIQNISCSLFFRRMGHLYQVSVHLEDLNVGNFYGSVNSPGSAAGPLHGPCFCLWLPLPLCVCGQAPVAKQLCTQLSLCSLLALPVFSLASCLLLL